MTRPLAAALARVYGAAWECRRRAYAAGLARPMRIPARVVSIGNLTVGGTGKTTLTLHLAKRAHALGIPCAVALRDYRPGPDGLGDEHRLVSAALGAGAVFGGTRKREAAARAAAAGARLVLVDDGFSHWSLARDLDVVLVDAGDPLGGDALLPLGRLREPHRALQRAGVLVLSRAPSGADPEGLLARAARLAPAALRAAGRHAVRGVTTLDGAPAPAGGRVRVVTATGNPAAVVRSAAEAGCEVTSYRAYRDHHWFRPGEARAELARAAADRAAVLLTAKDAVRWPLHHPDVRVLQVEWEWVLNGDAAERAVFEGPPA